MDVLSLLAEGKTNREIAEELVPSVNTVKWYAHQIYGKLDVGNREEAGEKALALGLLPDRIPEHNLPAQLTPFVGRQQELATLRELLADPAVRLITVVGPGGVGKTRLALEAASIQVRMFPEALQDGVFFVRLAEAEEVQDVTEALVQTLDLPRLQEEGEPARRLRHHLKDKQLLLLLDNVEHLTGEELAGWVTQLLRAAPGVRVLATSRRRLRVRGEQVFWVEGLQLPAAGEEGPDQSVERLLEGSSALSLFVSIARQVQPEVALTGENIGPVVEICRLVEGMPLGIELAAGWMGLLEPGELLRELQRTPDILATQAGNVPSRQRSLRAVFNTSWRLLREPERDAMRALFIFRGGFTLVAAEEIAGVTLPLLLALVDKCWLKRGDEGRFSLHELLRQYGMEALAAEPERFAEIRRRHSRYYCGWLAARETEIVGTTQEAVLAEMEHDMGNILAACREAARAGESESLYPALNTLGRYYRWRGRYLTGDRVFRRLLEEVESAGRPAGERQMLRARMLVWCMTLNGLMGRTGDGSAFAQEASGLVDQLEEGGQRLPFERMQIAIHSGYHHLHLTQDPQKALHHLSAAHELAQGLESPWAVGMTLSGLSRVRRDLGDLEEADQLIAQSIALLEAGGAPPALAEAIGTRITLLLRMGRLEEAEVQLQDYWLGGAHPLARIYRRFYLARIRFWLGEFEQAEALASEAAALCGDMKMVKVRMWAQSLSARIKLHQGDYADAVTLAEALLESVAASWEPEVRAYAQYLLGARALAEGQPAAAGDYLRQSLDTYPPMASAHVAYAIACLALAARAAGNPEEARRYLVTDLKTVLSSRTFPSLILPLMVAALLLADDGAHEQAATLYARVAQRPFVQNSVWLQAVAGRELGEVVARLSSGWVETEARAQATDLWETAAAVLEMFE
jgi:predicted ATPase/DNA-binding CsgD family transcriptional regulator/tetratricopeptide (TPR) repeat protein